jgi:hypothetical protein
MFQVQEDSEYNTYSHRRYLRKAGTINVVATLINVQVGVNKQRQRFPTPDLQRFCAE